MNLFRKLSEEVAGTIVAVALTKERTAVQKLVSQCMAQTSSGTKIAWQQLPPLVLRATVTRAAHTYPEVARQLVTTWMTHSKPLREAVWAALQAQGYAPPGPAPTAPTETRHRLRPADILTSPHPDDPSDPNRQHHYFRPGGQPLLGGKQDEAVAVMAYFLGWSVLSADEDTLEPLPAAAPAAAPAANAPLPGDDDPELLALEARFAKLSEEEISAIPPRESALLVARSQQQALRVLQGIVAEHHAGTYRAAGDAQEVAAAHYLEDLQAHAAELADQLAEAADQLRRGELPASLQSESEQLAYLHTWYEAWTIRVGSFLGPVSLPPAEGRTVAVLFDLAATVHQASSGAAVREAALALLAQLARLQHRSQPDFAPLAEVQARALALAAELETAELAALPAAAAALHQGTHPWATLWRLASDTTALEHVDEQSAEFQALEEALPRTLVTALLLRKLEPAEATETPAPAATEAAAPTEPAERSTAAGAAAEPAGIAGTPEAPEPSAGLRLGRDMLADHDPEAAPDADAESDAGAWLPAVQWRLLTEKRLALATHLTRAAGSPAGALPGQLLTALLLAPAVQHPEGYVASMLKMAFDKIALPADAPADQPHPLATRLLEVAAALGPALLAPKAGTGPWLAAELPALSALSALCRLVVSRETTDPLRSEVGFSPPTQAAWQQRMDALRLALNQWEADAQATAYRRNESHPATRFLRQLLQPDQPGGQLLGHLRARGPAAPLLQPVQDAVALLTTEAELDRLISAAGLPLRPNHLAWPWLMGQVSQLADLAFRWLYLRAIQPGRGALSHADTQERAFCQKLAAALPPARQELAALLAVADEPPLRAALPWAEAALAQLHTLLHHPMPDSPEAFLSDLLYAPLLPYATIQLDLNGQLRPPVSTWLPALREAAAQPEPSWTEAFASHLGRGQHQATARIIALPGAGIGAEGEALTLLQEAHHNAIDEQKEATGTRMVLQRGAIELALRRGWLSAAQRNDLLHQNARLMQDAHQCQANDFFDIDFGAINRELDEIEAALQVAETAAQSVSVPGFGPANAAFTQFFTHHSRLLEQELESHPLPELLGRLAQGGTVAGTLLHATRAEARAAAAQALGAWEELRGERSVQGPQVPDVEQVLAFIGFEKPRVGPPAVPIFNGPDLADLNAAPLADGTRCPVAHYGSAADGHYRLVFVWRKTGAEQLLDEAQRGSADQASQRPTILVYFNILSEHQRHDLAALSRQRRQTVLVLDRLLLTYLATAGLLHPDRLALFFQLTLPFAWLEPFPSLAPEMFVGREAELAALVSPVLDSPSILLGGPQTGKTAVLRQLVARHHRPEAGQLVLLLNVASLGQPERLLGTVEREVKRLLVQYGLVPAGMAGGLTFAKALRYVRTWMRAQADRRLVLIFDDAADFVVQDTDQESRMMLAIGELMMTTDFRFKMLMACREWPLPATKRHNMLRLGPLLPPADAGAAESLLRRPLESLGMVFDDEMLVSFLLIDAHYSPARLQEQGQQLLAALYAQPQPAAGERPAYRIGQAELAQVLAHPNPEAIEAISTLVNQSPYHNLALLALASAEVQEQFGGAPGSGLGAAELVQVARHYLPHGWGLVPVADDAYFAALLNEFVDAGLALRTTSGQYFLSEPHKNAAGSEENVQARLARLGNANRSAEALASPAPPRPTPKTSMLKRLTNGRNRL